MWLSRRNETQRRQEETAQVGRVTLPGDPAGAVLGAERRDMPVFGPGGYAWRPRAGQEILVVKAGADKEQPCAAGVREGGNLALAPGEIYIDSGGASIFLSNTGTISMWGDVLVNGKPVLVQEG